MFIITERGKGWRDGSWKEILPFFCEQINKGVFCKTIQWTDWTFQHYFRLLTTKQNTMHLLCYRPWNVMFAQNLFNDESLVKEFHFFLHEYPIKMNAFSEAAVLAKTAVPGQARTSEIRWVLNGRCQERRQLRDVGLLWKGLARCQGLPAAMCLRYVWTTEFCASVAGLLWSILCSHTKCVSKYPR